MEKTTPYISAGLVRDTYSDTVAMLAGIGLGKKIFENRRSRPLLSREKKKTRLIMKKKQF